MAGCQALGMKEFVIVEQSSFVFQKQERLMKQRVRGRKAKHVIHQMLKLNFRKAT